MSMFNVRTGKERRKLLRFCKISIRQMRNANSHAISTTSERASERWNIETRSPLISYTHQLWWFGCVDVISNERVLVVFFLLLASIIIQSVYARLRYRYCKFRYIQIHATKSFTRNILHVQLAIRTENLKYKKSLPFHVFFLSFLTTSTTSLLVLCVLSSERHRVFQLWCQYKWIVFFLWIDKSKETYNRLRNNVFV